jgi:cellobiose phosphorylase
VAFTALYASNLRDLSQLVLSLEKLDIAEVEIASEMLPLLDSESNPLDYELVQAKQELLKQYYESNRHTVSGTKTKIGLRKLANDLVRKADWLSEHLRSQEFLRDAAGYSWFNGYYDDDGQRVEGDHPNGVRMTLTGQVFTLMSGVATDEQAREMVRAADHYLYDPSVGGYRLNTNFEEVKLNLGRAFGFAYGHKENGAMFSHMAVMYANALYQRGFVRPGYKVLSELYQQSQNFPISRMYPGIPEYFNPRGRGMYTYLTGSASWYLLTLVTQVYGVRGEMGDLRLEPKLVSDQFDQNGQAIIKTLFADKFIQVVYQNPKKLDYGQYRIAAVQIEDTPLSITGSSEKMVISRESLFDTPGDQVRIKVQLSSAPGSFPANK